MEDNCIFCNIAAGKMDASVVYQDEKAIAFEDINPQAPHHVLVVPREHIESLNDISQGDEALVGHLFRVAARVADQRGFGEEGFRTVVNNGARAGQTVDHVHVHVLGGRDLTWPPG